MRSSGAQYGGALAQMPRTLARISRPAVAKSSPRSSACSAWGVQRGVQRGVQPGRAVFRRRCLCRRCLCRPCICRPWPCVCLRGARVREEVAALAGWQG